MREPTRIVGMFGAVGLGTFALLILASWATAQPYDPAMDPTLRSGTRTQTNIVIGVPPAPATADPAQREAMLRASVASHLAADPSLAGSNITVTSANGTVILNGTVAEAQDIQAAEMAARRVPGVVNVAQQLQVNPPQQMVAVQKFSDADLSRRVAEQLAATFENARVERSSTTAYEVEIEPGDADITIRADASTGQITLNGDVPNYDTLGRAISVARTVPGVQTVVTNLTVETGRGYAGHREGADPGPGPFAKPSHKPVWSNPSDHDDRYDQTRDGDFDMDRDDYDDDDYEGEIEVDVD